MVWCVKLFAAPPLILQNNQAVRFEHLTTEDGLSYPNVYGIFEDKRGFIWFATKYGLNRYDGMDFTLFTNDPDDPASLSNNFTWNLYQDTKDNLWVITYGGGLEKFDPVTETFIHYQYDPENPDSINSNYVWCIFEDSRGNLWVGTDEGLNHFDPANGRFTSYIHDPEKPGSLSHNTVTMITEDDHGYLWIGTYGGGLNRFDPATTTFRHYQHQADTAHSLSHDNVNFVFIDQENILWVGTGRGLNKLPLPPDNSPPTDNSFSHYFYEPDKADSISHNRVRSVYEDASGSLWFATSGGLSRYDRNLNSFTRYTADKNNPNSLNHNSLYYITGDSSGTLWIGTANGVSKADPGNQHFAHHLSGTLVNSIYDDSQGTIWVGTSNGIKLISSSTNVEEADFSHPAVLDNIQGKVITSIQQDTEGKLWISTLDNGINHCDQATGECIHYRHNPYDNNSLGGNAVLDIAIDAKGIVWLALSGDGLDRFDPHQHVFKNYRYDASQKNSLVSNWVRSLFIDSADRLWIGTEGGISRYNPDSESFDNYKRHKNLPGTLSDHIVNMVIESDTGMLWVATNNGLNRYDPATDKFTVYRTRNGLPGNSISAIAEDNLGNLWISTNNGLSQYSPKNNSFSNYTKLDGLQGKQFLFNSVCKNSLGKLYFGGTNGFNSFLPQSIITNANVPQVYLTDLQLFNESVQVDDLSLLSKHISFVDKLILPHEASAFSLGFVALNFRASPKNRYAYRMEGFDTNWIYSNSEQRVAKYTNLDPGSYVFRVKGSNNDGVWNSMGASLNIIILPAWWMTWWFRGLLVCMVTGMLFGLYYWRTNRVKQQNITLEALVAERTAALNASEERYRELFENMGDGVAIYRMAKETGQFIFSDINKSGCKIINAEKHDLLGKDVRKAFPGIDDLGLSEIFKEVATTGQARQFPASQYTDQRISLWVENFVYKLSTEEIVTVFANKTEQKKNEEKIQAALHEKEILLKEIHHRVKNNMQIIQSFLSLQKESIKDSESRKYLTDSETRIQSMALVHEALYKSPDMANLNTQKYFNNIVEHLSGMFQSSTSDITINLHVEQLTLTLDQNIACGLIINELVSNAFKYAFTENNKGVLTIQLRVTATGTGQLIVHDTGNGFPADFDINTTESLGLKIVRILTVGQLHGEFTAENRKGAYIEIQFTV